MRLRICLKNQLLKLKSDLNLINLKQKLKTLSDNLNLKKRTMKSTVFDGTKKALFLNTKIEVKKERNSKLRSTGFVRLKMTSN